MFENQLNELQSILQGYFDNGLYSGITNTSDRVSIGKLSNIPTTPHINIEYLQRNRQGYATSGLDKIDFSYDVKFILKPSPDLFTNNQPKIKEITDLLNRFSNDFLDKLIKENKYGGANDAWYFMQQSTDTELKQFDTNTFFINSNLTITNYDN
jgi:hypothetical protein